jgi:DNA helicase-2/ATP-dependent DNA helicase PcrA
LATVVPGPIALGRSVVVAGGPVPAPWRGVEEVVVDDDALAAPEALVGRLHVCWSRREPVVVRLDVDPARFRHPRRVDAEPWSLPADLELWDDRLQFLVWTNAYDARADPGRPVWWWARKAARLGATPVGDGRGDVELPDGRRAWIDGGPRRAWTAGGDAVVSSGGDTAASAGGAAASSGPAGDALLDGAVVVHAESVERGRLTVSPAARPPAAALAPDQQAAVAHGSGPARVIAPAGSGKTRVLTERLRHLLEDQAWEPDAVLAVAYNKKAQEELDARTAGLGARTRTLNSLGLWVLARARGRAPRVMDEREVRAVVERLAPPVRRRSNTDPIGPYLEALGAVRLGLRDPAEVEASRDDVPGLAGLWPGFRAALADAGALDFDDQVYGAIEVLLADGELRGACRLACRHLLVDEFQDLTPAHVLLLRLLASPAFDCFGVGDDDQVIYGHAGADPAFLIDYERLFPGAGDHPLEVNYRCRPEVVRAASTLLGYNRRRVAKQVRPGRGDPPPGSPPPLEVRLHEPAGGVGALAEAVRERLDAGAAPASIAVLTRVNALLLAPVVALGEAGIPVASTVRADLLERTGLRAALAYVRLATAPGDRIASRDLVEVLRRPSRGLPPWFAERLRRRASWTLGALERLAGSVPDKDAPKVERLLADVAALRAAAGLGTAGLLRTVREDIGLGGAMSLLDAGKGGEGSSHLDDLEALESVAELQPDPGAFEAWLRAGLERPARPEGVTASTVHRVKGREWDHVVVAGVNAGLFPHRLAEDVEEERRVLHVAVTRGRETVVLLADRSRPSPMLAELEGRAPRRP